MESAVNGDCRGTLTIKHREKEGIVSIRSSGYYADSSGITNSGITFHANWHNANQEQYTAWKNHLADKTNANRFLTTLASEGGVYVRLSGMKIRALTREEPGRIIYAI